MHVRVCAGKEENLAVGGRLVDCSRMTKLYFPNVPSFPGRVCLSQGKGGNIIAAREGAGPPGRFGRSGPEPVLFKCCWNHIPCGPSKAKVLGEETGRQSLLLGGCCAASEVKGP